MGLFSNKPFPEGCEIFTTGQMIDTLKYGEIAECLTGFYEGEKVYRTDRDEIAYLNGGLDGGFEFLKMTTFAYGAKWRIYKDETYVEPTDEEE